MPTFPRRFLPPISVLCSFEAAARHQSFTSAAAELHLTQSAVSRQIGTLERMLGAELFVRERQTVRLTVAGRAYAQEVREALRRISSATLGFRANPRGGTLNLAILPTFGTRWLAPRLAKFLAAHPGITINLTTRLAPFDFGVDALDAAIHFGLPDWPNARLDLLMGETIVPACSPALLREHPVEQPADLLRLPLLHLASRPDAWADWFRAMRVVAADVPGMLVDQFAIASQAAISGLGVALLPELLIETELASGQLVVPVGKPMPSAAHYYLAWPASREDHPPLQAFRRWIVQEASSAHRLACDPEHAGR